MFTVFSLPGKDNIVQERYLKDLFFKSKYYLRWSMTSVLKHPCCRMAIYQNYLFYNLHCLMWLLITPLILPSCLLLSSCIIIGISISLWLSILMKLVLVICLIHGKDPFLIRSSARYLIAMYCINKVPNIYKMASIFLLVLWMKQVISFQSNNRKWKKGGFQRDLLYS